MNALPYYKWYWIDYRANRKVQRMSWQARGLYRELLDEFWSEGFLPNDTSALADICCCDLTTFLMHWPQIAGCFAETDDGLVNAKMDEQRTTVDAVRAIKARAGSKGGKVSNSHTRAKETEAHAKHMLGNAKHMQAQPDIAEQSRAEQSSPAYAGFELPAWISKDIWETYLEVRASKRAAKTPRAWAAVVKQLAALKSQGHDPNAILETSVRSNWTDVYAPKNGFHPVTPSTPTISADEKVRRSLA